MHIYEGNQLRQEISRRVCKDTPARQRPIEVANQRSNVTIPESRQPQFNSLFVAEHLWKYPCSFKSQMKPEKCEKVSLSKAAGFLLDECRMVLPGLQALFGFQLIAVFNSGFDQKLSLLERQWHFAAIALSAVAVVLIMTPAALHRQRGSTEVTESFIRISSRLLLFSMIPLAFSISIDFYLVGRLIAGDAVVVPLVAALIALFAVAWFILPHNRGMQSLLASQGRESNTVRELDNITKFPNLN
jgi:hypothetical protein